MPKLKLGKGALIGDTWHEAGAIVDIDAYRAPQYLKEGATPVGPDVADADDPATPVGPDVADADDPATHAARKADAPHHKAKH